MPASNAVSSFGEASAELACAGDRVRFEGTAEVTRQAATCRCKYGDCFWAGVAIFRESERLSRASELMLRFAERTGLTSSRASNRYLWTDAFAVCNFLGLARETGDDVHRELALRLIDKVHHELGRHRRDDHRSGWLSGLPEAEGEAHPTRAGLRIGKARPERRPDEPFDDELEWNRDGQYFHYLAKWMHALDQTARATGQLVFHSWARELADVAHRAFTYGPVGRRRMIWKASVDLSRPLVASMGAHDPLDGFATCVELESTANAPVREETRPH